MAARGQADFLNMALSPLDVVDLQAREKGAAC
jgi:hypothetical protein